MAIRDVIDLLACPHCGAPFALSDYARDVRCANGHAFDLGRPGYLNLMGRAPKNADTPAMVAARERFLSAGHYQPVAERLVSAVTERRQQHPSVLDCGSGPGYYLSRVLGDVWHSRGLAADVSVAACKRAARSHPRLGAIVADTWHPLPVVSDTIDVIMCVFAPRNPPEFHRVLAPNGALITVTPTDTHLAELRTPMGLLGVQQSKQTRLEASLSEQFTELSQEGVSYQTALDGVALGDVIAMGPNAFHLSVAEIDQRLTPVQIPLLVTVSVSLSVWAPRR